MPFTETLKGLETVTQSEANQKEKNKYIIIVAYMWNRKMVQTSYLKSRNRDTGVKDKHIDTKGRTRGWDELRD